MLVPEIVRGGLSEPNIDRIVVVKGGAKATFDVHDICAADFLKARLKTLEAVRHIPSHHFDDRGDCDPLANLKPIAQPESVGNDIAGKTLGNANRDAGGAPDGVPVAQLGLECGVVRELL